MKDYYCKVGKEPGYDFLHRFAREFCIEGFAYRAGDAVNFAIGQGDTVVTPLQLARGYAAIANGGTLYEPRIGKAIVSPDGKVVKEIEPTVQGHVEIPADDQTLHRRGAEERESGRHHGVAAPASSRSTTSRCGRRPAPPRSTASRARRGSRPTPSDYIVVMMVSQGGTGSGTSGPAIRAIYEALYGIKGKTVRAADAGHPGHDPPERLPVFADDGSILPPATDPRSRG